jgi:predicted RNA-binding Zn-ribbon protein involved in translation (DUF1610 family)
LNLSAVLLSLPFLRRNWRFGYGSTLCVIGGALCAAAWFEGTRGIGQIAVREYVVEPGQLDESMIAIYWGNGGLSLQRRVDRLTIPAIIIDRSREQNPMARWVRTGAVIYPFGPSPETETTPRPFPLSWGFQFSFHRNAYGFTDPKSGPLIWSVTVPIWFLLVLLSIPPAFWLRRTVRRYRRNKKGLCLQCGYDIRASADRCPECGSAIATRTKTPPPASDTGAREDKQPPTEEPTSPPSS